MEMQGGRALVLGGVKGVGKAIALDLARSGAKVAVIWHDWESFLPALERDLKAVTDDFLILRADLRETAKIAETVDSVARRFGGLNVLVNNIERGGWPAVHGPYTEEQWDLEFATTLRAKRWAFEAALPHLRKSENACVVNVSSIAGIVGRSGPAAPVFAEGYSSANAGISVLTRTWARMGAPEVRVNEIMLGFFDTRHGPETRGWDILTEDERRAILDHTLLNRTGGLDDVTGAVRFLVNDAPFMTGGTLVLDGGYILGGERTLPVPKGVVQPGESVLGK